MGNILIINKLQTERTSNEQLTNKLQIERTSDEQVTKELQIERAKLYSLTPKTRGEMMTKERIQINKQRINIRSGVSNPFPACSVEIVIVLGSIVIFFTFKFSTKVLSLSYKLKLSNPYIFAI